MKSFFNGGSKTIHFGGINKNNKKQMKNEAKSLKQTEIYLSTQMNGYLFE